MKTTSRLLPLIGLVLTFSAAALGQGSVAGTVHDLDGAPLEGAHISIDREEIKHHFETVTDDKGKYFHAGLPSATYRITLSVDGQVIQYVEGIKVSLQEVTDVSFDLQALAAALAETEAGRAAAAERARKLAAGNAFDLGRIALQEKRYQAAIEHLKGAIEIDETQHVMYSNLADAYTGTKQFEEAANTYRMAILLAPMEAGYYNNLGIVLGSVGKIDEAIAALEKTAELNPTTAGQAYYNLGAVMTNTGRMTAAAEAFKKAIEFDPDYAEAYYQLGISYFGSAATMKEAIPVLQKYLEMAPDSQNAEAARQLITAAGGL